MTNVVKFPSPHSEDIQNERVTNETTSIIKGWITQVCEVDEISNSTPIMTHRFVEHSNIETALRFICAIFSEDFEVHWVMWEMVHNNTDEAVLQNLREIDEIFNAHFEDRRRVGRIDLSVEGALLYDKFEAELTAKINATRKLLGFNEDYDFNSENRLIYVG